LLKDNDVICCHFDNASEKDILTDLNIPLSRSSRPYTGAESNFNKLKHLRINNMTGKKNNCEMQPTSAEEAEETKMSDVDIDRSQIPATSLYLVRTSWKIKLAIGL